MRHERLRLLRFASRIEPIDEHHQTSSGRTEGSLRATESHCCQLAPGGSRIGPLQDVHCGRPSLKHVPGNHVPVRRIVKTGTYDLLTFQRDFPLAGTATRLASWLRASIRLPRGRYFLRCELCKGSSACA